MHFVLLTLLTATSSFPEIVQRERHLESKPDCNICHAGGVTGAGTVTTDYGKKLLAAGLEPYDDDSLIAALSAIDLDPPTLEELDELVPEYGCSASSPTEVSWLLLIGGVLWCLRERRTADEA